MCCLYVFELTGCSVVLYHSLVRTAGIKESDVPRAKTVATAHNALSLCPHVVHS